MISAREALEIILKEIQPLGGERIGILEACGRVLAEDVSSDRNVPPFANSAMDGYAVLWEDVGRATPEQPRRLQLLEVIPAGSVPSQSVRAGATIKIMTGSPIPAGADTVVRVEDAEESGGEVRIKRAERQGAHIRDSGEDILRGQVILERGHRLKPADIGLLASVGRSFVLIYQRPRVAIVSTGDELVEVDEALREGQIVNSNAYTLSAVVAESGAQAVPLRIARDRPEEIREVFTQALRHDLTLSTGGVSVGDFDFVKEVMDELGVRRLFWQVAQKPGKPLTFGVSGGRCYFALPGNPVSSLVCFYLYVRPALRKMMGWRRIFPPVITAVLAEDVPKAAGLTEFVRCRIRQRNGQYLVSSTGSQSSGVLSSLSQGGGLIVGPPEPKVLSRGSEVKVIVLNDEELAAEEVPF
jgi:molybdopterin molybdotransferase